MTAVSDKIEDPAAMNYLKSEERGYLFESALQAQKSGLWAKT